MIICKCFKRLFFCRLLLFLFIILFSSSCGRYGKLKMKGRKVTDKEKQINTNLRQENINDKSVNNDLLFSDDGFNF